MVDPPARQYASAGTKTLSRLRDRIFARKSIADMRREADAHGLKRSLGPLNLLLLGVGCILGAGIYVMTGTAAAQFAGPAVLISFLIAGLTCGLVGLCYAELASSMPVSGSSYSYCHAAIGEGPAWLLGWLLLLEYGVASSLLASGFAGYLTSLLAGLGYVVPPQWSQPMVQSVVSGQGTTFVVTGGFNLVAGGAVLVVAAILCLGISKSAKVNNALVAIKVCVLVAFVAVGVHSVDTENWKPFIPANEGGFSYGWPGIFRAASLLFFAYIGFEAVSTAASESRSPQRDMPIGILGSLVVCTVAYIAVALVLTGIVPFRQLGVPDPIALAVDRIGWPKFAAVIKLGALMGLASVLLVNSYAQSRIGFAMARDGLLPGFFSRLHRRWSTPYLGTLALGLAAAAMATLLPLSLLADLISIGTAFAFAIVCLSVMWLRSTQPDLERPFRVPLGGVWIGKAWIGVAPTLAILLCLGMIVPTAMDVGRQALGGDIIPAAILIGYLSLGVLLYLTYGLRRSRTTRKET